MLSGSEKQEITEIQCKPDPGDFSLFFQICIQSSQQSFLLLLRASRLLQQIRNRFRVDGCDLLLQLLLTLFRLGQVKNQIQRIAGLPGCFKIEILTGEVLSRMFEFRKILRSALFPLFHTGQINIVLLRNSLC